MGCSSSSRAAWQSIPQPKSGASNCLIKTQANLAGSSAPAEPVEEEGGDLEYPVRDRDAALLQQLGRLDIALLRQPKVAACRI
jgi:hypothetical protein